jgi:hypothetical protein
VLTIPEMHPFRIQAFAPNLARPTGKFLSIGRFAEDGQEGGYDAHILAIEAGRSMTEYRCADFCHRLVCCDYD